MNGQVEKINHNIYHVPKKYWIFAFVLFIAYICFVASTYSKRGAFEYVGIDFRLWYSTGMIARYHGFSHIYDFDLQTIYQKPLYNMANPTNMSMPFWPLPLPYISVFTLPMYFLSFFSPKVGFILWTIINLIIYIWYCNSFCKRNNIQIHLYYQIASILCLPLFLNFFLGQVNLIMLISLGESVTALRNRQELMSGLWLAGLILKPQTLLLFLPIFILQRKNTVIRGLILGSFLLILISLFLSGFEGLTGPFNVITNWSTLNHQDILGDSGTTFLSLFLNLIKVMPIPPAFIIVFLLTILVVSLVGWLWIKKEKLTINALFLFTFTISCTITPHSNIHMLIPLLPLLLLAVEEGQVTKGFTLIWIFIPAYSFILFGLASTEYAHVAGGLSMMVVNLTLLIWKVIQVKRQLPLSSQ